jgi:hypothetical protein
MEFFMKKSILASSIAAAVFGLGAVTGAQASDVLLVPYFSAQGANATLLSITNTDTQSGKAVKVRFRGAANSDDVFDFQVFLSPTDVWTANISKGADGRAVLTTTDASCTKPAASVLNATPFLTSRLDPALSADAKANGTREGYVEIINMADIPPSRAARGDSTLLQTVSGTTTTDVNPLFTAIKHVKSVAPCSGTAYTNLDLATAFNNADYPANLGMRPGTGKLQANWTIVNTVNAAAWGGEARAVSMSPTNVIYAPQIGGAVTSIANYTADPLFLAGNTVSVYNATSQALQVGTGVAPAVTAGYYDLPDLSTPMTGAYTAANAAAQVKTMTTNLTAATISNEFAVESAINGSTDWVFSMPSRRYHVAMAYSKISATDDGRRWNRVLNNEGTMADATATPAVANVNTTDGIAGSQTVFGRAGTSLVNGLICVNLATVTPYDREENTPTSSTTVVVSPSTVAGGAKLCGETGVLSFNNGVGTSKALEASVAVTAIDVGYSAGWATMTNTFPIIGGAFQRAAFGAQGFGVYRAHR